MILYIESGIRNIAKGIGIVAIEVIKKIMELDGEELETYVTDRVVELETNSDDSYHKLPSIHNGFISKNTEIKVSSGSMFGYSLRGVDYLAFAKYLKELLTDVSVVSLICLTGSYVGKYFGYDVYKSQERDIRDSIINKSIGETTGKTDFWDIIEMMDSCYLPSINIFRNTNQAVCLEHSTLMQNLLSFLGITSSCFTMLALQNKKITGHVANIISVDVSGTTKHIYFDLINMEVSRKDGVLCTSPTMKLVSDEEYKGFVEGTSPLTVVRKDCRQESGETTTLYLPQSIKNTIELQKRM